MSLYKRGDVWHYRFTVKGRRFRGSTDESNKYLAGLVEANKFKDARENWVSALTGASPALEAYAADFTKWIEETHSIEPKTKKCYQNGWRLLKATKLSKMKLDEITNRDCEVISFPGGPSNANQALRTLRRMFSMAKEEGKLQNIPSIKLRKEWGRSIAMSIADAEKIVIYMAGDPRDAFIVIRGGGFRPEEAFSMRWEYIQWENKIYQNPDGKTERAGRPVPFICWSEVIDPLAVLQRRHVEAGSPSQGWVFPSERSRCGHLTTIKAQFVPARAKAGLPDAMVLYTGRHGVGTDLAKITSLKQVMDILGHSQTKTAMHYQHPQVAELQEKLDSMRTTGKIQ